MLVVAIANFAAGRLGLLLAVPPGYASPVFPSAGIALAATLLFGYRVWPGVFLGSIAINYSLDPAVAVSIAAGSSVQAIIGSALIRTVVGFPVSLADERAIAKFLVLGGPVSCLIASVWGNVTLSYAGLLDQNGIYHWFTWWVGDSIGVVVFSPLLLALLGEPRDVWRPRRLTLGLPVIMALTAVVGLLYYAQAKAESDTRLKFHRLADNVSNDIENKIQTYLETMNSVAGLYDSSEQVSRQEFRRFVERALTRQPGISALGWVPRVRENERAKYEQMGRADAATETDPAVREGLANYRIKWWKAPNQWLPYEGYEPLEIYPVHFIEPFQGNEAALGIDLASNPARRAALRAARHFDQPIATGPLKLAQTPGSTDENGHTQLAVLLVVPIYPNGAPREGLDDRITHLRGFASGVVRLHDLVSTACSSNDLAMVNLSIVDDTFGARVYGEPTEADADTIPREGKELQHIARVEVGGRPWNVVVTPSSAFIADSRQRQLWGELTLAFLAVMAVVSSTLVVTGRRRQVEILVEKQTEELRSERTLLRRLIDIQEQERRLVAHDIHDGFVQDIVGAHFHVQCIDTDAEPEANERTAERVGDLLKKAIAEGRRLIRDLRPMVLDESGVIEAIEHFLAEQRESADLVVAFEHELKAERLDARTEGVLFRIVQEAISNVRRHARTNHAAVQLEQNNGSIHLTIRDQGTGFDLGTVRQDNFGLRGIYERARLSGGHAEVTSTLGGGTIISVTIPALPSQ